MGTNFYFENIKSREEAEGFNAKLENLTNEFKAKLLELGCDEEKIRREISDISWNNEKRAVEIHIGKRSYGWLPLFQIQEEYKGISGMKEWYEKNKCEWRIRNEYDEYFTWDELVEELIDWNKDSNDARTHLSGTECHFIRYYEIEGREWTDGEFS